MEAIVIRFVWGEGKMKRKVKILYLIQLPPPIHGVSTINDFIYHNELINKNIDKYLIEIRFARDITELRKASFRKIWLFFRLIRQLKNTLNVIRPDYVYFSIMPVGKGFWRDLLFVRQIRKSGVIPVYHLHNRGIEKRSGNVIFRRLYRFVFQDSIVIHLSENLLDREILRLKLNHVHTEVIPNGVPRVELNIREKPDSPTRLLFVSNLFPSKGIYALLRIMQVLRDEKPDVRLKIGGAFWRDKYRHKMNGMIEKLGLDGTVSLAGPVMGEEKWDLYREADIFVFPSRFREECFPLVVLEAMQFGLPVIASGIGAIPEIIEHGVEGYLYNPEDDVGFAGGIRLLTEQKDRMKKMGSAARAKYLQNYTASHLEKRFMNLYDNYLSDIH